MAKNDQQGGKMFELDQSKKLFAIQYNEVNSQLHMIYESVNMITNAKALEHKFTMEIEKLTEHVRVLKEEQIQMNLNFAQMLQERDQFRQEVFDLKNLKLRLEQTHSQYVSENKEAMAKLNNER